MNTSRTNLVVWGHVLAWLYLLPSCVSTAPQTRTDLPAEPTFDQLAEGDVAALIPATVSERRGWATDVLDALSAHRIRPAPKNVCAVLAIIEQESGFSANPRVKNLGTIVEKRLRQYAEKLGPLGDVVLEQLLDGQAPGHTESFRTRLKKLRTERDLDRMFRELVAHYEHKYPKAAAMMDSLASVVRAFRVQDLNPITTAGSMQVSVRFAADLGAKQGLSEAAVREKLYTRRGGVYYGTARLLGYEADYDAFIYRFADYNAGFYASRNAALQSQLTRLTGIQLSPDGDLLAYDKQGHPLPRDSNSFRAILRYGEVYAPSLSRKALRRDTEQEKALAFQSTSTYRSIKASYRRETGDAPAYARLPDVSIQSPKLSRQLSTRWFAENVDRRFQRCLARWERQAR